MIDWQRSARSRRSIYRFSAAPARLLPAGACALLACLGWLMGLGAATAVADTCPNAAFRTGPAANLPDCRAYELVSVPDSGGHAPLAHGTNNLYSGISTSPVGDAGNGVTYETAQGSLPGFSGSGGADRYLAERSATGWSTKLISPTGEQLETSDDTGIAQGFNSFFVQSVFTNIGLIRGTLADQFGNVPTSYIRWPDGTYDILGRGSLGTTASATGRYISPGAQHVIFDTADPLGSSSVRVQLEPEAPPHTTGSGNVAIYDRTESGPTKVISIPPGSNTQPAQDAIFRGASADGTLAAFQLQGNPDLYVHAGGQSYDVTPAANTFAGIFGGSVFYSNAAPQPGTNVATPGDLFSFDPSDQSTTQITNVGDARFVNVSADGSRVYFVSDSQIDGEGAASQPNLYLWERDSGATTYVATVTTTDVTGDLEAATVGEENLATWSAANHGDEGGFNFPNYDVGRATALSRSTPDGSVLVFESVARLTPFDNAGHTEIYRYDAGTHTLACVSCAGPEPAVADSHLQSAAGGIQLQTQPLAALNPAQNLSADGGTVAFESASALVPQDSNGKIDIYRWKAGDGVALISSGTAIQDSYLYGMTPDARDIFFTSPQSLVPQDENGSTPALYDARVSGGFPAPSTADCAGDACQGPLTPAPSDLMAATSVLTGPGNSAPVRRQARLRLLSHKAGPDGITLKVRAPAAGTLSAAGRGLKPLRKRVASARTASFRVQVTKASRRRLAQGHRVAVRLIIRFVPSVGRRSSIQVSLTLRPQQRSRAATGGGTK